MLKRGFALLFQKRDFGLLMATQFLAQAGDGIVQTALAKFIVFGGQEGFDIEGASNPQELLRLALYIFIPYTIISPFLGVVIDRWDRRRLLFVANALRALLVAAVALLGVSTVVNEKLPGLVVSDALPSVVLFIIFMLTLAGTRVVLAAKAAALPATLGESSLVEGNAVSQLGGALFQLGGAGVAFVATSVLEVAPVALVGAIVYGAGAFAAIKIQRADEGRTKSTFGAEVARVVRNIAAGVKEVSSHPKAAVAISTYFWLRFVWSFTIVGIAFVARDLVANDDLQVLVLTGGAGAVGAALGFLGAARLTERFRTTAQLVVVASAVAGFAVLILGGLEFKASIAVLTFFLGFGFFLAKISLDTMVQEALGDDFRGRAFSLYDIAYNIAWVAAATLMKVFWDGDTILIAIMGGVFLIGLAGLTDWFRRAGLLAPTPSASEA
jgi:MFS family permease